MLTQNKIKFIKSLKQKKYRDIHSCFVAEGAKLILDLYESGIKLLHLYYIKDYEHVFFKIDTEKGACISIKELQKISQLKTPPGALAVFEKKAISDTYAIGDSELVLYLDNIQDPGNMGTIIRTADWFGVSQIVCNTECADIYNYKVVQATMGAIGRVGIRYIEASDFFNSLPGSIHVYGTFLEGETIYKANLTKGGVVVMGNEGNGISAEVERNVTKKLFIPSSTENSAGSESLNVAIATGVVLSEFRRSGFL